MRSREDKVEVPDPKAAKRQARTDKITRLVALVFVFVSVFYFFIKLLYL